MTYSLTSPRVLFRSFPVLLVAFGCAYYNGLYNANRLADQARKAEREGRGGEARTLWSRVVVKTDSVLARYPTSSYRDDALLLRGTALFEIGACDVATGSLIEVADSSPDPELRSIALRTLSRCHLLLDNPDLAAVVLSPLADDSSAAGRSDALWIRGRAYLDLGENERALADLEATFEPGATFDRARALIRLRRGEAARTQLLGMPSRPYNENEWLLVLDQLGADYVDIASDLTDSILARGHLTEGQRARLQLSDGLRWSVRDSIRRAAMRYGQVRESASDSLEAQMAAFYLVKDRLLTSRSLADIPVLLDSLRTAGQSNPSVGAAAGPFLIVLDRFVSGSTVGFDWDLRTFLIAEEFRDSVRAFSLASQMFQSIADSVPHSVIAPKALLAAAQIDPVDAVSLRERVMSDYPESAYTLAFFGHDSDRFAAVEDSLLSIISSRLRYRIGDERDDQVDHDGDADMPRVD